ncbi:MAG TPA: prepilin-type N-terminal cleavage/methylation domain-containing protein [candidate division Zixibacteria bacterium]|nr:prepilin-type N-terminal cleavage/methylation domain-containing protein [candidate division Zixibacteria bacterium]
MKILKIKSNKSGFTILEVVIAMLILSMSLLLLLNMAMVALDGNDWSNKTTNATQLIQEKLEQLRSTTNPAGGNDVVNGVTRTWVVSNAGNHLRRIDITVQWDDVKSKPHSNAITTYIRTDST